MLRWSLTGCCLFAVRSVKLNQHSFYKLVFVDFNCVLQMIIWTFVEILVFVQYCGPFSWISSLNGRKQYWLSESKQRFVPLGLTSPSYPQQRKIRFNHHLLIMSSWAHNMMTSSNGNIFRVTGHLRWEFTGLRWIPRTKASDAELWCFLWSAPE